MSKVEELQKELKRLKKEEADAKKKAKLEKEIADMKFRKSPLGKIMKWLDD